MWSGLLQGRRLFFLNAKAKLGGDFDVVTDRSKSFPDPFLTGMGAVDLGGVKKSHALLNSPPDQGDHVFFGKGTAIVPHHGQTSEPDGGNFQRSEPAMLHPRVPPHLLTGGGRTRLRGAGQAPHGREQQRGGSKNRSSGKKLAASHYPELSCGIHKFLSSQK